jgi:hypothetical protein
MECRQFHRFTDEMALNTVEIDQLWALLVLRDYYHQSVHLGIPLPKDEDLVAQNAQEDEEGLLRCGLLP